MAGVSSAPFDTSAHSTIIAMLRVIDAKVNALDVRLERMERAIGYPEPDDDANIGASLENIDGHLGAIRNFFKIWPLNVLCGTENQNGT